MYDIWKKQTINELEIYNARKAAEENILDQLRELEAAMVSIRSPGAESVSTRSGGSKDARYLNNIVSRDLLKENLKATRKAIRRMEKAMAVLTGEEREILEFFFVKPEKEAAFTLADRLNIDRKTVYARREDALKKLTIAMYGNV